MLYVVGTPIGNLKDLSIRQAETLIKSDYILAENTGSAGILLQQIPELFPELAVEANPKVIPYHKENEFEKLPEVLELLKQDKSISLISESGMPLICDPGQNLIRHLIKSGLRFEVVPGPTALTAAVMYSGFDSTNFSFKGFLPKKESDKKKIFASLERQNVYIFYESPFRIQESLRLLSEINPECEVVICRELTKKFEEIIRGKPGGLMERDYKGELTLVINIT